MAIDLDESLEITIEEVRGEKKVGVRGDFGLEKRRDIRELVSKYGDALVELYEIENEHNRGLERRWHIGRVVEEEVENEEEETKLSKLVDYAPFELASAWSLRRYNNFYNMFPDGEFDSNLSTSKYDAFCTNERMEKGSREAYDRFKQYAERPPRVWEIRAWGNLDSFDDLEKVVSGVYQEGVSQTDKLAENPETLLTGTRIVLIMAGKHPDEIDEKQIESIIVDEKFE